MTGNEKLEKRIVRLERKVKALEAALRKPRLAKPDSTDEKSKGDRMSMSGIHLPIMDTPRRSIEPPMEQATVIHNHVHVSHGDPCHGEI